MSNSCSNALRFEGNEETIQEILDFIRGDGDMVIDFQKLIPVPLELQNSKALYYDREITDGKIAAAQKNIEKYGYSDWYDFCCIEWGTKCNAGYSALGDNKEVFFETAWLPPFPFLKKLSEKYPDVKFITRYFDECMSFIGICEYKNGEVKDRRVQNEDFKTEEGQILQQEVLGEIDIDADGNCVCGNK